MTDHKDTLKSTRHEAERIRAEIGGREYATRCLISREWWLNRLILVTARLGEVNSHSPEHYYTTPRMTIERYCSDGFMPLNGPVGIGSLTPVEVAAYCRLQMEWKQWCANERAELLPDVARPGWQQTGEKSNGHNGWGDTWQGGVNPWVEYARGFSWDLSP